MRIVIALRLCIAKMVRCRRLSNVTLAYEDPTGMSDEGDEKLSQKAGTDSHDP